MNESGWVNESGWMNEWMIVSVCEWVSEWVSQWVSEWVSEWTSMQVSNEQIKALWYSYTLAPPLTGVTSPAHCLHHVVSQTTPPTHCGITMGVYRGVITPLLCTTFYEWGSHICTWNILYVGSLSKTTGLWFSIVIEFDFWIPFVSNLRFETRIHQLHKNVDSMSSFEMFSIACSDFEVTFLIHLGWIVDCAMSVYVKFNIFQKGITNEYERYHFKQTFCNLQLHVNATPTLKIQSKYQCKLQYFTMKCAISSQ